MQTQPRTTSSIVIEALDSFQEVMLTKLTSLTEEVAELRSIVNAMKKISDEEVLAADVKRLRELSENTDYGDEFKRILSSHCDKKFYITVAQRIYTEEEMLSLSPSSIKLPAIAVPNLMYCVYYEHGKPHVVRRGSTEQTGCMCRLDSKCKSITKMCLGQRNVEGLLEAMSHSKNLSYIHPELLHYAEYFSNIDS